MIPPTRPQPPLIDDGYLVEPEPLDDRVPRHTTLGRLAHRPARDRRPGPGCSVLGFLLLAIAMLVIAAPRAGQYVTPAVTLEGTSRTPTDQLGAPHGTSRPLPRLTTALDAAASGAGDEDRSPARGAPQPTADIGTALVAGVATWFDAPGLQAAVPWWQPGQEPVLVRVCASRCIVVTATGFCACGDRDGRPTIADLSRKAFARLAPLSQGVVEASMEWPIAPLPNTDKETR